MQNLSADFSIRGRAESGILIAGSPRLWTPAEGSSGLVTAVCREPLLAVVGGRVWETRNTSHRDGITRAGVEPVRRGEGRPVTLGGLVIMSGARQKEPTRVIGHPDLASGASVQRGDTLYVSVAEAIYRESRGEYVEIHLTPTAEDNAALADLRARARHRWENDRLPDGWTRPLPPTKEQQIQMPKETGMGAARLSEELRRLAEDIKAREKGRD
jgi:hypothetical protein